MSITAPQFRDSAGLTFESLSMISDLGFGGIFLFDHLVPLGDAHRPVLELTSLLGAVASFPDIRLGTLVMRAPMRGSEISARVALTAATLAPRRFVCGLGTGDLLSDEENLRFGHSRLGLDARLEIVAATMSKIRAAGGSFPVWLGGTHHRLLDLAVAEADGWNGWGLGLEQMEKIVGTLRAGRSDLTVTWGGAVLLGRHRQDLEDLIQQRGGVEGVIAGTPDQIRRAIGERIQAGADELIVSILPNRPERWELFAAEVLAPL